MATATFIKTNVADPSSVIKSQASVDVDGVEVTVEFWFELIQQWGKEGAKQYLCAEALWATGYYQDAIDLLQPEATGTISKDKEDNTIDTRNWQANWLDNHPLPTTQSTEVDPLV